MRSSVLIKVTGWMIDYKSLRLMIKQVNYGGVASVPEKTTPLLDVKD
jgi:hypothetical protein